MADKRSKILKATLKLISERGFHGTPISKIAREAGVASGTIYHYFDNKEDLINELYNNLTLKLSRAVLHGYSENLPLRERFCKIWINIARFCVQHPMETGFMMQYANSPFSKDASKQIRSTHLEPVVEFVEYAVKEQVIKDLPREMLYCLFLGTAFLFAQKHVAGKLEMNSENMEKGVAACWDSVKR